MPTLVYGLLALIVLCSAAAALLLRRLAQSVIALGVGSASLAMSFFFLNAPYAAGFELSVGAGLISILLIIGISLTEARGPHSP